MEDEGNEDVGLPPELGRMVAYEDQEMGPHQEEIELVDLGIGRWCGLLLAVVGVDC